MLLGKWQNKPFLFKKSHHEVFSIFHVWPVSVPSPALELGCWAGRSDCLRGSGHQREWEAREGRAVTLRVHPMLLTTSLLLFRAARVGGQERAPHCNIADLPGSSAGLCGKGLSLSLCCPSSPAHLLV